MIGASSSLTPKKKPCRKKNPAIRKLRVFWVSVFRVEGFRVLGSLCFWVLRFGAT